MRESATARVTAVTDEPVTAGDHLVGTRGVAFRACQTTVTHLPDGGVSLPREAALALGVAAGDTVRFGRLRGRP